MSPRRVGPGFPHSLFAVWCFFNVFKKNEGLFSSSRLFTAKELRQRCVNPSCSSFLRNEFRPYFSPLQADSTNNANASAFRGAFLKSQSIS
jgi:hypothetical protein